MTAIEAARAAGWWFWLGSWYSTDLEALGWIHPIGGWRGTARDLCLAHGIQHQGE